MSLALAAGYAEISSWNIAFPKFFAWLYVLSAASAIVLAFLPTEDGVHDQRCRSGLNRALLTRYTDEEVKIGDIE